MAYFKPTLVTIVFLVMTGPRARADDSSDRAPGKSQPDVVIYRGEYPGWPWIARAPSGKLICVWREGTEHGFSAAGKLMLSTSDDEGVTWSAACTFYDGPGVDDRNVAILPLTDDDWLVAFNTYTSDHVSRVMTLRTSDAGAAWSAPQPVCDLDARTRSAPIRLSSGELLLPLYRAPGDQSLVGISEDDGKTWDVVEIPNHPDFVGDEWDVVELPDRRLVGLIRNSARGNDGSFYKTESRDGGRTWTRPAKTNLRDSRSTSPAQIFLCGERPVALYADARMVSVAMAVSSDPELIMWDVENRLRCYYYRNDHTAIADSSYPVSAPVSGGRRLVVDYQIDGDDRLIAGYFVTLPRTWQTADGN